MIGIQEAGKTGGRRENRLGVDYFDKCNNPSTIPIYNFIQLYKNKPNRATMRPSCALSGGNFGVVTGFIDKSLKYTMRYCGSKLYQQIILIKL